MQFRGRVLIPDYGYWPRPYLELQLRAAIGGILDKPKWWIKWHQYDEEGNLIRLKWLRDIEQKIVHKALKWTTKQWYVDWDTLELLREKYIKLNTTEGVSNDSASYLLKRVDYYLLGVPCVDEVALSTTALAEFNEQNQRKESYGQVIWYFALVLLNRQVRELLETNTLDVEELDVPLRSKETLDLVENLMLNRDINKAQLQTWCPDADVSPHMLDALWVHVEIVRAELEQARLCVLQTLEKIMREHKPAIGFISNGPVDETWISDGNISEELKIKFETEVAELERGEKDWHPESNDQVLDLVHPSLYCCVFGVTTRTTVPKIDIKDSIVGRMHRCIFGPKELVVKQNAGKYQWLPSEFHIDNNGKVTIQSYINNLHPVHFSGLYDSIADIFTSMVPMFENVLSCLADIPPFPVLQSLDLDHRCIDWVPKRPRIPNELPLNQQSKENVTLRGTTLQVIVKIAEIVLTPEKTFYSGGSWHVEGTDSEQIVATGIYYFGCENITKSTLSFRVLVSPPDYQHDDNLGMAAVYGLEGDTLLAQDLGSVTTINGRSVVFPNTLQHHVDPFELLDPTKPGVRKILAFFVVDPNKRIPSTLSIAPQQQKWLMDAQQSLFAQLGNMPDVVFQSILPSYLESGMTLDQAKFHRVALMKERRVALAQQEHKDELNFSLCEH